MLEARHRDQLHRLDRDPKRISWHRVFEGLAAIGKSTMGWFYGFKLHLIINERGDLLALALTPGNIDDRKPRRIDVATTLGQAIRR